METFAQWIESQLNDRGWKPADLARAANVTDATLSNVLNGNRKAGPDLCRAIAKAFAEPEEKVFRLAGLLSPLLSPDDPSIEEINSLVKHMSPDQRKEILRYVRYIYQSRDD